MIHKYDHSSQAITVSHPGYYLSDPLLLCSLLCPSDRHHILWQLALKDCKVQYRDQIISGKGAEKDCVSAKPEWLLCHSRAEKLGLHKKKWLCALLKKKTTFLSGAVCYHDSPPAPLVWNHPSSSKCKNTNMVAPSVLWNILHHSFLLIHNCKLRSPARLVLVLYPESPAGWLRWSNLICSQSLQCPHSFKPPRAIL